MRDDWFGIFENMLFFENNTPTKYRFVSFT